MNIGSEGVMKSFGYMSDDELKEMKRIIRSLGQNSICVNIGAGSGTSGLAFIECDNVAQLYTVDLYKDARPEGALGNELTAFKDAGHYGDPRYHQIHGDSTEAGKQWKHGEISMVFIDGDHSYEHCKSDIEAWLPHIAYGGVMALHDYKKDVWPGVEKAVEEVLSPQFLQISQTSTFIAFRII